MDILLGQRYRDTVSGWVGTAVARYEYLNGCVRYEVAGADKDGKPDSYIFDEQQLVAIGQAPPIPTVSPLRGRRRVGGDRSSRPVPR